jgi:phospholipid/cholesterol/gamma-HCH transport system substrate-binding protein
LAPALVDVRPLLRTAEPTVRTKLRPLVHDTIPVVRELLPSVKLVNRADPDLIRTVNVLTYVVNELLFNPPGGEEGYLFQLAWFAHNGSSLLSLEDAHGAVWRGLVMVGCSTLGQGLSANPALAPIKDAAVCP